MRLLFVGNFNVTRGTGYSTILKNVCCELAPRRHTITVLGTFWDRSEHHYPFQVIPTDYSWIPVHVLRVHQALDFDHVILAMDVPKVVQILDQVEQQEIVWPRTSALFPIESDPLVSVWAEGLGRLHRRFVISRFGQRVLSENDLDSVFVPMTAEIPEKELHPAEARGILKKWVARGDPDLLDRGSQLLVLTVADNMERKDLPVIGQALARLREREGITITWALVTAIASPYGWWIPGLLEQLDVVDRTVLFEALPPEALDAAYWACDVFVIASQAEGACLPLYEAMARGKPCVAPDHTAITEALDDGRGVLVSSNGRSIHPWGNVYRYHTRPEDLARALLDARCACEDDGKRVDFIKGRPWSLAARQIEEALSG
jgi:glycosyltransferase involved in cell wall biosynthesis